MALSMDNGLNGLNAIFVRVDAQVWGYDTDSDVNRFSFGFVISLWLQHGNVGIGRLWRTSAFTLQPNLVKLRPLFASVVVKTYQNPPCWFQERTLPHSSIKERTCLSFAFSMRGTFCPDTIPLKFNTALL
ncbi:hypothetical protein YC2023_016875 [Brassica napus]